MSNPYLILEWSDSHEWVNPWSGCAPRTDTSPMRIPAGRGPTVLHPSREIAETEAKRLAAAHPTKHFAIFEAVLEARTVQLPSHVTLAGEVFAYRSAAVLLTVGEEQPPF